MRRIIHFSYNIVWAFLVLIFITGTADAYNLPGSSRAAVQESSQEAVGITVRSIKDSVRSLRDSAGGVTLSTSGGSAALAFAETGAGQTALTFRGDLRSFDNDRLDGSLFVGSVLIGHEIQPGILLFGGLLAERLDVDTAFDAGTVEADGIGFAAGVDYRVTDQFYLTAILGRMQLDYDVTRLGGAVAGTFDAERTFIELGGEYHTRLATSDLRFDFSLFYYDQDDDGYRESGASTALVAPASYDQLTLNLGVRNTWGSPGAFRPFVDLSGRYNLDRSSSLPTSLAALTETDWDARLAVGVKRVLLGSDFSAEIGANFREGGFDGADARLLYSLRF